MNLLCIRRFSAVLLALMLAVGTSTAAPTTDNSPTAPGRTSALASMRTTTDQATAAQLIYGLLSESRYAYRPHPLNAQNAQDVFRRYLDALDAGKQFLTAQDIDSFTPLAARTADALSHGDVSIAFEVFARYHQRVSERMAFARQLLQQGFDFTADDRYYYDRKNAAWSNTEELNELWRASVKNDWLRLRLAGKEEADIRQTLDRRYASLLTRTHEIQGEEVFSLFMNAYTSAVDPHTDYFTPRAADNFTHAMSLSLQGIGAQLQRQDEMTVVRQIIVGGPAAMDGTLQPGDRIIGVGQGHDGVIENVIGWRLDDVVDKIRGPKGTQVRLEYLPVTDGVDGAPRVLTLTRQQIRLSEQAAKGEIITLPASTDGSKRQMGVIRLPSFYQDFEGRHRNAQDYASATRDTARLLAGFKADGVDGVVLDLRNNGGGSLDEAVDLTGLFIHSNEPVVQVREAGGRLRVHRTRHAHIAWDGPLVVLTNRASASASEIFAGAIQDYGRGLIIGETSFGKGTVQNVVSLDQLNQRASNKERYGQVKLTIAQFFRVSGSSTQHHGVEPDIAFPASVDANEYGENTYDNALPWARIAAVSHARYGHFSHLLPQLQAQHAARVADDLEFQWLQEDVQLFREEMARKYVSLNEAQRHREREEREARRLHRQTIRRERGMDLDPLADASADDGLIGTERDVVADAARSQAAEARPDPLLRESAAILADMINLLENDTQLAAQVLPRSALAHRWTD